MQAETKYAKSGELNIAYQVLGDGPIDFVFTPGYMSHLEQNQWWPPYRSFLEQAASFSRFIDTRDHGVRRNSIEAGNFGTVARCFERIGIEIGWQGRSLDAAEGDHVPA